MTSATRSLPGDLAQRRRPTRRIYIVRRIWVFGLLALALIVVGYAGAAAVAPAPVARAVVASPPAAASKPDIPDPGFGGYALGAVDYADTLAGNDANTVRPLASITKVITALVVLERKPWTPGQPDLTLTITDRDVAAEDAIYSQNGSTVPMRLGTTLTLAQALQAILLPSANNYAVALANWAFGSVGGFAAAANAWLAKQGLRTVHVADPTGLSEESVGSPADLVKLGKLALANTVVAGIVSQQQADVPGIGLVRNTNRLLGRDGVLGIKTGILDGKFNLLFARKVAVGSGSVTLVGAILGGPDSASVANAAWAILRAAPNGFRQVSAIATDVVYATYTSSWGAVATAHAASAVPLLVWTALPLTVTVETEPVRDAARGTQVGTVTARNGGHTVTGQLRLDSALTGPDLWWRWTHPGELFGR